MVEGARGGPWKWVRGARQYAGRNPFRGDWQGPSGVLGGRGVVSEVLLDIRKVKTNSEHLRETRSYPGRVLVLG